MAKVESDHYRFARLKQATSFMLQCTMNDYITIQLGLEDLLAELHFARRNDQLGRLALLAYCEVKGWARRAGKSELADTALRMFSENPCVTKDAFLHGIDDLITTLELHEREYQRANARFSAKAPKASPVMELH
jgi:hypothetical protein